jgi:hypothetical protein
LNSKTKIVAFPLELRNLGLQTPSDQNLCTVFILCVFPILSEGASSQHSKRGTFTPTPFRQGPERPPPDRMFVQFLYFVQRRTQPQDRHLRSTTLPGAPGRSILGPRTKDLASRGPRNLRSSGTLSQKRKPYMWYAAVLPPFSLRAPHDRGCARVVTRRASGEATNPINL